MTSKTNSSSKLWSSVIALLWVFSMGMVMAFYNGATNANVQSDLDKELRMEKSARLERQLQVIDLKKQREALILEMEQLHEQLRKSAKIESKRLPKEMLRDSYIPQGEGDGAILLRSWIERRSRRNSKQDQKSDERCFGQSCAREARADLSGAR